MSRAQPPRAVNPMCSSSSAAVTLLLLVLAGSAAALRPLPLEDSVLAAAAASSAHAALSKKREDLNLRPLIGIVSQVRLWASTVGSPSSPLRRTAAVAGVRARA